MSPERSSREASVRLRLLLFCMDSYMSHIRDARMGWVEISLALGLGSTEGKSVTRVACEMGVTKQALSRGAVKFLRMSQLSASPAFGMKSPEARRTYAQTNGRHDHTTWTE
jgi:hypothetical protein